MCTHICTPHHTSGTHVTHICPVCRHTLTYTAHTSTLPYTAHLTPVLHTACTHTSPCTVSAPSICTTAPLLQTPSCLLLPWPWAPPPSPLSLPLSQLPYGWPKHLSQRGQPKGPPCPRRLSVSFPTPHFTCLLLMHQVLVNSFSIPG